MSERDPWVRVGNESELREGMAVQLRRCACCSRSETNLLLKRVPSYRPAEAAFAWIHAGGCLDRIQSRYGRAIREGRLFRLADDQLADDAEPATVVRGREMERAR